MTARIVSLFVQSKHCKNAMDEANDDAWEACVRSAAVFAVSALLLLL